MGVPGRAGIVTAAVRRAGAYALVGALALSAPTLGTAAAVPFLLVALAAAFVVTDGPLFELLARPGDRGDGRLSGLAAFSLSAAGLALLSAGLGLPARVFAATVLLLSVGNLVEEAVRTARNTQFAGSVAFATGGFAAAVAAQAAVDALAGTGFEPATAVFLAASGALLAALLRSVLYGRDDPLVMLAVGLLLWLFADLGPSLSAVGVGGALAVTVGFGYVAYALDTASVAGMLAGTFLGLQAIVLGGPGWFAVLIAFFGIGGLSTKYRYDEKRDRGVAEPNAGARGSRNVLGNSAVALLSLLGFAAAPQLLAVPEDVFLFAFAGSVATALADTLSSEIGGIFDDPRLITTLEPVEPGTDGGVTWQGEVAGVAGAAVTAGIAVVALGGLTPMGAVVVALGGVGGMTVDSLLGATVEGGRVGNQSVNFLATLGGAIVAAAVAVWFGFVPMG